MALHVRHHLPRLRPISSLVPLARASPPTSRSLPKPFPTIRTFSISSQQCQQLTLAYDLHKPSASSSSKSQDAVAPIIFMHGLFGSKRNNRTMSKMLARDLNTNVYAVDLRNHGDSPHDARHDYSAMADDIEGFIAEHKLETPTLIGHSMGAKTAMVVALRKPDLVSSIIPVDNAPIDAALQGYFGKYMQGMKKIEAARVKSHKEADAIFQEYEKDLPIRQFILTNLTHTNDPETQEQYFKFRIPLSYLAAALDKMGDFPFKDPDTTRFVKPTLFVRGTKSHYVADEALPVIGQFFPRFELVDIDCGHWVIAEEPEKFRKAVVEFLTNKD